MIRSIDHTHTTVGRQRLYWRVRSGEKWTDSPQFDRLADRIATEPELREAIAVPLARVGRSLGQNFWSITQRDSIRIRWWYWFFPVLTTTMLASIVAIPFEPRFVLLVGALAVSNMVIRALTAGQIPLLTPLRQVGPLIHTARKLRPLVGETYGGTEPLRREIASLKSLQRLSTWISRDPNRSNELAVSVQEYLNILFIIDANALLFGARKLRASGQTLARIAKWVGDIDVVHSVAATRAEAREWCKPELTEAPGIEATGLWHPLLEDPVANDVELVAGRGTVLTGANMSGKSTYLRTVGIATVLARAIGLCPAARGWRRSGTSSPSTTTSGRWRGRRPMRCSTARR